MTFVHVSVYNISMKKRDVEKRLKDYGWKLARNGASHDVWTNGQIAVTVPRHREINELTAKGILRKAKDNPPRED